MTTHRDVLRLLHRLVDHLGACADVVQVDGYGKIVQIEISEEQINILNNMRKMTCRVAHIPEFIAKSKVQNITNVKIMVEGDEKPKIRKDTSDFIVDGNNKLWTDDAVPDKGRFFACKIGEKFRYAYSKQVLSNFCTLDALPLKIGKSAQMLKFQCVESVFQLIKIIVSKDYIDGYPKLNLAVTQPDPGEIKSVGRSIKTVDPNWFNKESGKYTDTVSETTMYFLQAWAATCPTRHRVLLTLMRNAVGQAVDPENVYFYEHVDFDDLYGTGCNSDDFEVMFSDAIESKGQNIMGKALKQTALKVWKLETHEKYIDWFKKTFEIDDANRLFVLTVY
jgi:hypothetical protein